MLGEDPEDKSHTHEMIRELMARIEEIKIEIDEMINLQKILLSRDRN